MPQIQGYNLGSQTGVILETTMTQSGNKVCIDTYQVGSQAVNSVAFSSPGGTNVTNSNTQILASLSNRRACFLTNIGNKDVYLAIGQTAIAKSGIFLGKQGGNMLLDGTLISDQALNGITSTGNSDVIFQEGK